MPFASRPVARNAHPRLHAGAHTESRTEQLSIRVQATHGQHTGPGPFQCRRRFPGCGRHQPPRRRTTRGPLRRRVPAVLRGGCSKHPLSMLPKSQGQQTSGQAVLLDTSGSGRRHRQTLSERLTAHLQTLSERPAVSCPGPVCVAQFVVLRACVTVCGQNRLSDLCGASLARAWQWLCWSCLDCVCVGGIDRVRRLVVDT